MATECYYDLVADLFPPLLLSLVNLKIFGKNIYQHYQANRALVKWVKNILSKVLGLFK